VTRPLRRKAKSKGTNDKGSKREPKFICFLVSITDRGAGEGGETNPSTPRERNREKRGRRVLVNRDHTGPKTGGGGKEQLSQREKNKKRDSDGRRAPVSRSKDLRPRGRGIRTEKKGGGEKQGVALSGEGRSKTPTGAGQEKV